MIYVVHNIVTFGTSVIVFQALVNTFIAVSKTKQDKVRKHEEKNIRTKEIASTLDNVYLTCTTS